MHTETINETQGPIACDGCDHPIIEGQLILSDAPEQIPEDFPRETFRHFHIHCHRCGANNTPCYQLYSSRQISFTAQANRECDRCGHTIHAGEDMLMDSFFRWNMTGDARDKREASGWTAGAGRAHKSVHPTPFNALPPRLKSKFIKAGGRGHRALTEAEHLYLHTVPRSVRSMGPQAIRKFLHGKDASHVESVVNAPSKANMPKNFVWEPSKWNRSRGPANMKFLERTRAHARNGVDATRMVGKNALVSARRGTILGVLMEVPVSAAEGAICVVKGKMSKKDAIKKATINTAKSGAIGGAAAAGLYVAAVLGAGPALAATSPVLIPAGVAIYGVSTVQRVRAAMRDPNPLQRVPLYFHASCSDCGTGQSCFEEFAAEIGRLD